MTRALAPLLFVAALVTGARGGNPDATAIPVLKTSPPAGPNGTKGVEAAIATVQRLAANDHRTLEVPKVGGTSTASDRITIAATATAGVALIAAFTLYRQQKRPAQP